MVMATLVPEANYASGVDHEMLLFSSAGSQVDIPDPLLENIGNEPIFTSELNGALGPNAGLTVFGYVPRNTWYKSSPNVVHGLLRSGQSLASFVSQRVFPVGTPVQISTNFCRFLLPLWIM